MTRRGWVAAAAVTLGTLAGTAAPASASDETLRDAAIESVQQVKPLVTAFAQAADDAEQSGDLSGMVATTVDFRGGLRYYKWSVVNRKASTPNGLAAKKQLLTAIREYDLGLVQFQKAYAKVAGSSTKASLVSTLKTAVKRINEATKDETAALTRLGVTD